LNIYFYLETCIGFILKASSELGLKVISSKHELEDNF
jgi:hypothetical protein